MKAKTMRVHAVFEEFVSGQLFFLGLLDYRATLWF